MDGAWRCGGGCGGCWSGEAEAGEGHCGWEMEVCEDRRKMLWFDGLRSTECYRVMIVEAQSSLVDHILQQYQIAMSAELYGGSRVYKVR